MKAQWEVYWNNVAADLEEIVVKHQYRTLYQTFRRLSDKNKATNDNIKKSDGTFVRSPDVPPQQWQSAHQAHTVTNAEISGTNQPWRIQAGVRPHRDCIDQIFVIHQLFEERIRCGKQTVIVFIDLKSAIDCIHWLALWRALESYNSSTSSVRILKELSQEFYV